MEHYKNIEDSVKNERNNGNKNNKINVIKHSDKEKDQRSFDHKGNFSNMLKVYPNTENDYAGIIEDNFDHNFALFLERYNQNDFRPNKNVRLFLKCIPVRHERFS